MRSNRNRAAALAVCIAAAALAGCGSTYYRVSDPASGNTYYTTKVQHLSGGAVKFTNARTDAVVTLPTSEVATVSKSEYKEGTGG